MAVKVGINGFGRIGRQIINVMADKGVLGKTLDVVAVVDVSTDAKYFAYQLKYDSVQGHFRGTVGSEKSNILTRWALFGSRRRNFWYNFDPVTGPICGFGCEYGDLLEIMKGDATSCHTIRKLRRN